MTRKINSFSLTHRNRDTVCRKVRQRYTSSSDNHEQDCHHVSSKEPHQAHHPSAVYLCVRYIIQLSEPYLTLVSRSIPKPATLEEWKSGIKKNRARLTRHLNSEPPIVLAAAIYARASEEHVTDPCAVILEALEPFNKLHNRVTVIVTSIYRQMGCIDLWKDAKWLCQDVQDVVDLLQDLLCSALLGITELRAAFTQGLLAYQQV